jgi:hypothetical protein
MAGFYFANSVPDVLKQIGPAARGLYVTTSDLPRSALDRTPAAESFLERFGSADSSAFRLEAAQTTELVVEAIARSDRTRASVLEQLRTSRVTDGLLGSFNFDGNVGRSASGGVEPVMRRIGIEAGVMSPGSSAWSRSRW